MHGDLGAVEMSALAGITRNTLRYIEAGDSAPSIWNYLRVISVLGAGGEMALLALDSRLINNYNSSTCLM